MEQAEASEPKRVVALAIDESEHAEKALECKSFYYYAEHFIDKNVGKFKKKKKKRLPAKQFPFTNMRTGMTHVSLRVIAVLAYKTWTL